MSDLLAGLVSEEYIRALIWTLAALALLLVVLFAVRMMRGFGSGTLIAGGRGRVARLAVVDAAAVDNQRRLVLVRRDDVEHLILIGGPSDVVIEQQIRAAQGGMGRPQPRTPAPPAKPPAPRRPTAVRQDPVIPNPQQGTPPSRSAPRVAPEVPRSSPAPAVERPPQNAAAAAAAPAASRELAQTSAPPAEQMPAARREEPMAAPAPDQQHAQPQSGREQAPQQAKKEESALLEDIDLSIDQIRNAAPSLAQSDESLDDEMSRLLNDLSNEKKD